MLIYFGNCISRQCLFLDKYSDIEINALLHSLGGSGLPSVQVHNMNPPITQDEGYLQFVSILDGLEGTHDLDLQCKEIIDMLKEQKVKMCDHPDILTLTIGKASILLPSNHFIEIIQKMTSMCHENSFTFQEQPLQCMLELIRDEKDNQVVFKYQKTFLQSIQMLIHADCDQQSRTTCLRTLIFKSEYILEKGHIFDWTEDFHTTVKSLLDARADPTWIPNAHMQESVRKDRYSASYKLFSALKMILVNKTFLWESLEETLTLFLPKTSYNHEQIRGTVLHALVEPDWDWLNEHLKTETFFLRYMEIMSKVISCDTDVNNKTNWNGDTPLQVFIKGIKLQEDVMDHVAKIVRVLRSDKNICIKNNDNQTVLHYIAEAFPIVNRSPVRETKIILVPLVTSLISQNQPNTCVQDKDGLTALHILAGRYNKYISEGFSLRDLFLEFVKIFADEANKNACDRQKRTVLHILVAKLFDESLTHGVDILHKSIECITSKENNCKMQDYLQQTFAHIMAEKYNKDTTEECHNVFCDLLQKYVNATNVDIKDNDGHTVLHILARKFPSKVPSHSMKTLCHVMKHLGSLSDAADNAGQTALHMMAHNYNKVMSENHQYIFSEIMQSLASEANTGIQDNEGYTILHVLADKYPQDIPENGTDTFLEIMKNLASVSNINIKNNKGRTVLHILAKNYKTMSVECQEIFDKLIEFFAKEDNIAVNNQGQTVMHVLVDKYPWHVPENGITAFLKAINDLVPFCAETQDNEGRTALHIIAKKYQKNQHQLFSQIFNIIVVTPNLSLKDNKGRTVLHELANKFPSEITQGDTEGFLECIRRLEAMKNAEDNQGYTALHIILKNYQQNPPDHCKRMLLELFEILKSASNVIAPDHQGNTVQNIIDNLMHNNPTSEIENIHQLLKRGEMEHP